MALDYLGAGRLVPGLVVNESKGTYSGIAIATRYKQQSVGVSLNYKVTDFSSFSLFAGHTQRTTHLVVPSNDPLALAFEGTKPAYTGSLTYQRQLSVKTSINLSTFRNFQQFNAGVNTTVDTGFAAGIIWKTTPKLSTTLDLRYDRSTISGLQDATGDERKDLVRSNSLSFKYSAAHLVSLRSYFMRRTRSSNVRSAQFDANVAGLELTAAFN